MSAIATMTLNDGKATPVAHTFAPVNVDAAGVAKWADRSGGIALGYPVVTQMLKPPATNGARNYKLTAKIVLPTLELTSPSTATGIQPAPTKAYDLMFNCELVLPERCTLAERKDLAAYAKNFFASAGFVAAIENFEFVY